MAEQGAPMRAAADPPRMSTPQGGMFQGGLDIPRTAPPQASVTQPGQSPGILPTDILPPKRSRTPRSSKGRARARVSAARARVQVRRHPRQHPRRAAVIAAAPLAGTQREVDRGPEAAAGIPASASSPCCTRSWTRRSSRSCATRRRPPAGAAARLAGGTDMAPKMTEEEAREVAKKLDDFDFNSAARAHDEGHAQQRGSEEAH